MVVFSGNKPMARVMRLEAGSLTLGYHSFLEPDDRISSRHAEILYDGTVWTVRDLESLNGTYVDGREVREVAVRQPPRVIRIGKTLMIPTVDVRPFEGWEATSTDGVVTGPVLHRVLDEVAHVARAGVNVLVTGETGTGKELFARAVHDQSIRCNESFVAQNCAAMPESLLESELFGHKKGTFTGADKDKKGLFELADGGTLFLDEIGEFPLPLQSKLLRVLQNGEIRQLGSGTTKTVDVRIVAATNRDLKAETCAGRFRADLYYRLNAAQIRLPPLRDRLEEVPWHVAHRLSLAHPGRTPHAKFVEACLLRVWPGNVRELHHAVDAAVARTRSHDVRDLASDAGTPLEMIHDLSPDSTSERQSKLTREEIVRALTDHDWNKAETARAMGIHRTQLIREMGRLGIPLKPAHSLDGTTPCPIL